MILKVFLSIVFFFSALALYFAPRNAHIGLRSKYSFASNEIWRKSNKFAAILFGILAVILVMISVNEISDDDFYLIMCFGVFIAAILSWRYSVYLFKTLPHDETLEAPIQKKKETSLTFSDGKKMAIIFSILSIFLIGLSYFWMMECLSFLPEDLPLRKSKMSTGDYALIMQTVFWTVQIISVLIFLIIANFFAKSPKFNKTYSLKLALSDVFFAYAATFALIIAALNYAFYRNFQNQIVTFEDIITIMLPFACIFVLWFALFKRDARLKAKNLQNVSAKKNKKQKKH